jgi:hypothetical protein
MKDICCICGQEKEMSFEHVPPRAAFNDKSVVFYNIKNILRALLKTNN